MLIKVALFCLILGGALQLMRNKRKNSLFYVMVTVIIFVLFSISFYITLKKIWEKNIKAKSILKIIIKVRNEEISNLEKKLNIYKKEIQNINKIKEYYGYNLIKIDYSNSKMYKNPRNLLLFASINDDNEIVVHNDHETSFYYYSISGKLLNTKNIYFFDDFDEFKFGSTNIYRDAISYIAEYPNDPLKDVFFHEYSHKFNDNKLTLYNQKNKEIYFENPFLGYHCKELRYIRQNIYGNFYFLAKFSQDINYNIILKYNKNGNFIAGFPFGFWQEEKNDISFDVISINKYGVILEPIPNGNILNLVIINSENTNYKCKFEKKDLLTQNFNFLNYENEKIYFSRPGKILKKNYVDLNSDNQKEKIIIKMAEERNYGKIIKKTKLLLIGDSVFNLEENNYKIVDIAKNDEFKEIVFEYNDFEYSSLILYYFNHNNLIKMIEFPNTRVNDINIVGNGKIYVKELSKAPLINYYEAGYKLTKNHFLIKINEKVYNTQKKLLLKHNLPLYKSIYDKTIISTIKTNEEITIFKTDNKHLFLCKDSKGNTGWFSIDNRNLIENSKLKIKEQFKLIPMEGCIEK
ncbi:MAG: hypothetical protein ACTSXH_02535 [Promethearchaeota archaeon]